MSLLDVSFGMFLAESRRDRIKATRMERMTPRQSSDRKPKPSHRAMTSDRLYQKAMDDDFVIKTLIRLSGTRFDPKVVQAFIAAYQDGRIVSQKSITAAVPKA